VRALHAAFCRGVSPQELLQLAASRIYRSGSPIVAVLAYLLDGDEVSLHASAGPTADRTRPPFGTGLPAQECEVEIDGARARLHVPIRRHAETLGGIEIDHTRPRGLDQSTRAAVRDVAAGLATLL